MDQDWRLLRSMKSNATDRVFDHSSESLFNLKFNRVTRWFVIFNKEFEIFICQEYRGYDCYLSLLLDVNLLIIKTSESTSYWLEIVRLIFIVRVSEFFIG